MKKVLFATTALVISAGVAAADVKLGGNARAGIVYNSKPAATVVTPAAPRRVERVIVVDPETGAETITDRIVPATADVTVPTSKAQVSMRLRFNFDASKQLDSGVTLGGRIRLQSDANRAERQATLNQAMLYATSGGLRVEVGNSSAAFDAMSKLYAAELGYIGTVQGSYEFANYAAYQSRSYAAAQQNRMGVYVAYTVGDIVARASYITPNQAVTNLGAGVKEELSVSFDYKSGPFAVGLGYAANGNFVNKNNVTVLYGEYTINGNTAVGLQLFDNGKTAAGADKGTTVTLYGNTKLDGGIGLGAFVSSIDNKAKVTSGSSEKTSYGIGASYDLGGAKLAGTVQRTHAKTTYADLGISFSF